MVFPRFSTGFALTAVVLAGPAAAQEHRIQLAGYAGAVAPLAELGQVAYPLGGGLTAHRQFKKGVSFGGNATLWLDNNLGLRADGSYAGSKVVEPLAGCLPQCTTSWTKLFFGVDIMLRRPTDSGMTPFGFFGAGAAKMSESGSGRKATRPIARVGGGLNYTPANGTVGFFGEVGLIVYDFDQTKFTWYDKVQTDLALRAGVSFGL